MVVKGCCDTELHVYGSPIQIQRQQDKSLDAQYRELLILDLVSKLHSNKLLNEILHYLTKKWCTRGHLFDDYS